MASTKVEMRTSCQKRRSRLALYALALFAALFLALTWQLEALASSTGREFYDVNTTTTFWLYDDTSPSSYMMYQSQPAGTEVQAITDTSFYSDTWPASYQLQAGTTTLYIYVRTSSTQSIDFTLAAGSDGGGWTTLGTGNWTGHSASVALQTINFSTSGFTFSAGDRLRLFADMPGTSACRIAWDSSYNDSRLVVPGISAGGGATDTPSPTPIASNTPPATATATQVGGLSYVYWVDYGSDKVQRANADGSNVVDLVTSGLSTLSAIAVDTTNGKVYWADSGTDKLQRANLDGSNVEDVIVSITDVRSIALDVAGGKIYFINAASLRRADLGGANPESLVSGISLGSGLALDLSAGKMYFTRSSSPRKIQRANLDGSNVEDVLDGVDTNELDLDPAAGKIYWTICNVTDKIQRANLDGTSVEDLVSGNLGCPNGIDVDPSGGKVYWSDEQAGTIGRANLDGTNVVNLVTGLTNPVDVMIAPDGGGSATATPTPYGSINEQAITFPGTTLNGQDQVIFGTTNAWRVISTYPEGTNWSVTIASSDFSDGSHSLAVSNFGIRLLAEDIVIVSGSGTPTSQITSFSALSTVAQTLLAYSGLAGQGSYDITPGFQLSLPAETYSGSYTATITTTFISGP